MERSSDSATLIAAIQEGSEEVPEREGQYLLRWQSQIQVLERHDGERRRRGSGKRAAGVSARRGERRGGGAAVCAGDRTRDARVSRRQGARERASARPRRPRKGREVVNQGRETLATAIERGTRGLPAGAGARERVTDWTEIFLGVIAVATLAMAIVQIGVIVAAGLLARRAVAAGRPGRAELKPLFGHLNAIGRDAVARGGAGDRAGRARRPAVRRRRRAVSTDAEHASRRRSAPRPRRARAS